MPLYAYRCTQCGHRFEKIQSFSAEPEKVCPECGGPAERLLTAPGLQFKGAGWYVNDYSSKSSAPASEPSSSSETKSDAKPAAKPSSGGDSASSSSGTSKPAATSGSSAS